MISHSLTWRLLPVLLLGAGGIAGSLPAAPAAHAQAPPVTELPLEDRVLEVQVQPLYSFGGADAEEWEAFSDRVHLGFDGMGRLYVLDERGTRLVVVGQDGSFVRESGRMGQGPGEFQIPRHLAVAPDGRVAIYDVGRATFIVFGADGSLEGETGGDRRSGPGGDRIRFLDADRVVGPGQVFIINGQRAIRGPGGFDENPEGFPLLGFSLEDGGAELLFHASLADRPANSPMTVGFEAEVHWDVVERDRIVVADSTDYRVELRGSEGGLVRVVTREIRAREVTRAMREREKERRLAEIAAGRGPTFAGAGFGGDAADPRAAARRSVEQMAFAEVIPVVKGLATDGDGRIWVERTPDRWWEPGPIDLLRADGTYLGTIPAGEVELPVAMGPGGVAAFIEEDELGAQVIQVVRITVR